MVCCCICNVLVLIRGPNFELVATANLTVSDVSDLPHTHDLCLSQNNRNGTLTSNTTLPLFEHFCCRLTIQPDCVVQPMKTSDVTLITNGSIEQTNGYARLLNFQLEIFDNEKVCQNNLAPSICTIKVTRDSSIKQIGDTDVEIKTMENGEKKVSVIALLSIQYDRWKFMENLILIYEVLYFNVNVLTNIYSYYFRVIWYV